MKHEESDDARNYEPLDNGHRPQPKRTHLTASIWLSLDSIGFTNNIAMLFIRKTNARKFHFHFQISQRYGLEWKLPFLGKKFCLLKNQNLIVFSKIILSFSPFQAYQAIHIVCLIILDGIFFCCLPSKWIIYVFTGLLSQLFDFTIFYYCPLKQLEPMCFIKFRLIIELSSFEWEPKTK